MIEQFFLGKVGSQNFCSTRYKNPLLVRTVVEPETLWKGYLTLVQQASTGQNPEGDEVLLGKAPWVCNLVNL